MVQVRSPRCDCCCCYSFYEGGKFRVATTRQGAKKGILKRENIFSPALFSPRVQNETPVGVGKGMLRNFILSLGSVAELRAMLSWCSSKETESHKYNRNQQMMSIHSFLPRWSAARISSANCFPLFAHFSSHCPTFPEEKHNGCTEGKKGGTHKSNVFFLSYTKTGVWVSFPVCMLFTKKEK